MGTLLSLLTPLQARLAGATLVGSTMTAGVLLSTQDPQTISKWSFAASDAVTPFLRLLDPEAAHRLALLSAELSLVPHEHRPDPPSLCIALWNRAFPNPVGLAAGFDKDGRAVDGLLGMGFGFMEIGSVTPAPQPGNPKPRVWRIPEQKAVINRYGFNSEGIAAVAERLGAQQGRRRAVEKPEGLKTGKDRAAAPPAAGGSAGRRGLVGVNLGKNKWTDDAAEDFVQGMHTLAQYADFLVVNVSSPNTPGLRKLQGRRHLHGLLKKVLAAREEMQWGEEGPPPLLLKISPDLSQQDMADIAAVALSLKLDGLIVGNTTVSRPDSVLGLLHADEPGGLSGRPLFDPSTHTLREMYRLTKGRVTLIGCGGIFSTMNGSTMNGSTMNGSTILPYPALPCAVLPPASPALTCPCTTTHLRLLRLLLSRCPPPLPPVSPSVLSNGPVRCTSCCAQRELAECLARDGFESVEDAVGVDHRAAALLHVHA
ncbi:unnamed protein product [Closterium sp. Naga37s-1]|nr:unnamed protein product [Closterium sp. Naga37s-1]